jgi:hypothetical protein
MDVFAEAWLFLTNMKLITNFLVDKTLYGHALTNGAMRIPIQLTTIRSTPVPDLALAQYECGKGKPVLRLNSL